MLSSLPWPLSFTFILLTCEFSQMGIEMELRLLLNFHFVFMCKIFLIFILSIKCFDIIDSYSFMPVSCGKSWQYWTWICGEGVAVTCNFESALQGSNLPTKATLYIVFIIMVLWKLWFLSRSQALLENFLKEKCVSNKIFVSDLKWCIWLN